MRQFYQIFEKSHALRDELSWTHYRLLLKVDSKNAREFYLAESKQIFASKYQLYLPTTRQLEQEINRERLQIEQEQKLSGLH